ncbi:MAG: diacylglycerol kinase family protein [Syntrophobacteraceae bacterium]|jgi:YegS/Rv2252/BmrU family lipid kinase
MRVAALVNPFAGSRTAGKQWPILLQSIGREAEKVDTFWSEYPGHCESIAASVRRSGYDRVIAVGGDGTLSEVLNGLWWEEHGDMPSLGMVPFGTGCDYFRNFENGTGMAARLKTALGESAVKVSLGKCRYQVQDGMRQRVFANVLGMGFDAEVVRRFKSSNLQRLGLLSYGISAIAEMRQLRPFALDGTVGDSSFRADMVFFAATLGRCFGKGMRLAVDASPSYDRFEFVRAAPMSPLGLLSPLIRAYLGLRQDASVITRLYGSRAVLGSSMPIMFEADGELLGPTGMIEIELIPDAFSFAGGMTKEQGN